MTLTKQERKDLDTKGFIHLTYGSKVGWENMIGSDDDPVFDIIDELKNKTEGKLTYEAQHRLDELWHGRLNPNVDLKLEKRYLKTEDYITHYLKKLKIETDYTRLKNKKFRIKTDKEHCDTNWIMQAERYGTCMMNCGRDDQLLYFIEGDPGNIGSCKRCLFKNHRKEILYSNGKKVNFRKELKNERRI